MTAERRATRGDLLRLQRENHRELIEKIGLGLVSLSVPLSGDPILRVRLLPGQVPPADLPEIRMNFGGEVLYVPLAFTVGPPIRALNAS